MYSVITTIYYRKTLGHVFTKPVQIEGTTQNNFFPSKLFFIVVYILPLGDASVCSENMAAPGEKSFCVLEYHRSATCISCKVRKVPLPRDLADLKARIIAAVKNIVATMLTHVWQELEYLIDVCSVTGGAHIEHL